jgi:hypothetical protein
MKRNVPFIGFIMGLFLPLIGIMIMKFLWFGHQSFSEFAHSLASNHSVLAKVLTMSLLINLAPFLYSMKKRYDYTMNGVVVATMLYAVLIVLIMFVW